jgi:hypothetical protein
VCDAARVIVFQMLAQHDWRGPKSVGCAGCHLPLPGSTAVQVLAHHPATDHTRTGAHPMSARPHTPHTPQHLEQVQGRSTSARMRHQPCCVCAASGVHAPPDASGGGGGDAAQEASDPKPACQHTSGTQAAVCAVACCAMLQQRTAVSCNHQRRRAARAHPKTRATPASARARGRAQARPAGT